MSGEETRIRHSDLRVSISCSFLLLVFMSHLEMGLGAGREYVLAFPASRELSEGSPLIRVLVTSAGKQEVSVRMSVPKSPLYPVEQFLLLPGEFRMIEYNHVKLEGTFQESTPNQTRMGWVPEEETMFGTEYNLHMAGSNIRITEDKALHIVATGDVTVQAASITSKSSDAYLALPKSTLGTEYMAACYLYKQQSGFKQGPTQLVVVAPYDDTEVTVTLPLGLAVEESLKICASSEFICSRKLNAFQAFQLQGENVDLTGTRVESSRPVAVFSGTEWTSVGAEEMGDHLVEQLPPTLSWGREFYTMPAGGRMSGDIYRLIANVNSTRLKLSSSDGEVTENITLKSGEVYEIYNPSDVSYHIVADNVILVIQYTKGTKADDMTGDPYMSITPSTEQYTNNYYFSTFSGYDAEEDFFHTYISIATNDVTSIVLDGAPIIEMLNETIIYPDGYEVLYLTVPTPGAHRLYSLPAGEGGSEGEGEGGAPFGAMLYGFARQEGYGHPLGQQLTDVPYVCAPVVQNGHRDEDCDGWFDEEILNGIDDDGDGRIDEDLPGVYTTTTTSTTATTTTTTKTTTSSTTTTGSTTTSSATTPIITTSSPVTFKQSLTPTEESSTTTVAVSDAGDADNEGQSTGEDVTSVRPGEEGVGGEGMSTAGGGDRQGTGGGGEGGSGGGQISTGRDGDTTVGPSTAQTPGDQGEHHGGHHGDISTARGSRTGTTRVPDVDGETILPTGPEGGWGDGDTGGEGGDTSTSPRDGVGDETGGGTTAQTGQGFITSLIRTTDIEHRGVKGQHDVTTTGSRDMDASRDVSTAGYDGKGAGEKTVRVRVTRDVSRGDADFETTLVPAPSAGNHGNAGGHDGSDGNTKDGDGEEEGCSPPGDCPGRNREGAGEQTTGTRVREGTTSSVGKGSLATGDATSGGSYNTTDPTAGAGTGNITTKPGDNQGGRAKSEKSMNGESLTLTTAAPDTDGGLEHRYIMAIILGSCIILGIPVLWCCYQCLGPTCSACCARRKSKKAVASVPGSQEAILPEPETKTGETPTLKQKSLTFSAFTPDIKISMMDQASMPNGEVAAKGKRRRRKEAQQKQAIISEINSKTITRRKGRHGRNTVDPEDIHTREKSPASERKSGHTILAMPSDKQLKTNRKP